MINIKLNFNIFIAQITSMSYKIEKSNTDML